MTTAAIQPEIRRVAGAPPASEIQFAPTAPAMTTAPVTRARRGGPVTATVWSRVIELRVGATWL
ncbi:hypothetical protein [Streptomyces sp. NPDC058401]|uniref:hypothetical protein n=1 Tax=Streptomyces sp. NPDC058401 TaxID=3346480 RepID=UPI00365878F9